MGRILVLTLLGAASLEVAAGWVQHGAQRTTLAGTHAPALTASARQVPAARPVARNAEKFEKVSAPKVGALYSLAWLATILCWVACALAAVTGQPKLYKIPTRNIAFTIAQVLAPLFMVSSVFKSLRGAANAAGWHRLSRMTYRRLNIAVATASLWLAAATWTGNFFHNGIEMLSRRYSPFQLTVAVTGTHCAVATLCLLAWRYSVGPSTRARNGGYIPRLARGVVGSVWGLVPHTSESSGASVNGSASHLDDPDTEPGRDGRNEYALACALFVAFAVLPNVVAFPLASAPMFLGERLMTLSRSACAWSFLAAVVAYVLKDASQRNRIHSGTTFGYLRRGLIASSGLHVVLFALRLAGLDGGKWDELNPVMLSCPKAAAVSVVMHMLVVFAALTPLPKEQPKVSVEASVASQAAAPAPARAGRRLRLPSVPKLPRPRLPSLPRPSLPTPSLKLSLPKPSLPRPSLPKVPGASKLLRLPKIPVPSIPKPSLPPFKRAGKPSLTTPVSAAAAPAEPAAPAKQAVPPKPAWTPAVGEKVEWNGKVGEVRYVGPVAFGSGEWVGVELEGGGGMHDGSVLGVHYFSCPPGFGVFLQAAQLRALSSA